jgi:3-hydroxyacyl-CoA dehydrogenase/enoyl-CoA hydratase/3-hydroxybutyryl-CoA epimerase
MERISVTLDYSGFRRADLIIEAVVEDLAVKHEVLAAAEAAAGSRTVLATNTSSLTVASMATALRDPSRFVGLHFFNPVHRMPLVEIVRGPESADWAVDTARVFATAIGKVPVVVGDAPGFFVNRVLTPYLNEALLMLSEGATVAEIDRAIEDFGMPMGPLRLLDEIGLDVAAKVTVQLASVFDDQIPASDAAATLVEARRIGRKGGAGFYAYPGNGRPVPDSEAEALVRGEGVSPPAATIVDRCVLGMLNGAAKALEEGTIASPQAADLALVLGTGFAPFRGGVFRYAEERGVEAVRDRMAELADTYGSRFAPAAALEQRRFYPDSWPEKLETL